MDIQTENEILRALKKLTVEEEEFCQPGGEYLYVFGPGSSYRPSSHSSVHGKMATEGYS